jgi:CheY-like chemotaxis protein
VDPAQQFLPPALSVLCVDDDREVRELLHEIMSHLGHQGKTAVDGMDAMDKLANEHFDLVITDLSMPHMDGIELIKTIKTEFDDVDVVAITAYEMTYKYTDIIALGPAILLPSHSMSTSWKPKSTELLASGNCGFNSNSYPPVMDSQASIIVGTSTRT